MIFFFVFFVFFVALYKQFNRKKSYAQGRVRKELQEVHQGVLKSQFMISWPEETNE